jgi:hypothetical protein
MEEIRKLLRDVENELSSEKFIKLYQKVREKYPPIKSYLTPQDLIECLHNQVNPDYILNDKILSSLILEYQTNPDSNLIGSYLLIVFKPGLLRIFSQFRERVKQFPSLSDIDLWLQIVTLFFEELNQLDFNKDKSKVASKILGRVKNHLRDYFKELFKTLTMEVELRLNPKLISCSSSFKVASEEIDSFLQGLVKLGVISETDKYILLATKVYGKSMREISQELEGISYANVRQKKARIEKKIKDFVRDFC